MREDWVQIEIEDIFKTLENGKEINQGWSPQCKNYPSPSDDIWGVLKTTAIQKNEFWEHENKELPKDKEVRAHLEVKVGDIILTCAGPRNRCGVACTVIKTRPKLLLSGKMYRFRPDERAMTTEFLTFFLQTQESWLAIDKMKTGTSDSGLNLTHSRFRKLPVRVAPLPEQRAIVAKIEELFSDLDQGIADLKKAQDQLKIYRQAVLKKAFEGELTKEWREQQTDLPAWKKDNLKNITTINPKPNKDKIPNDLELQFLPMRLVEEVKNKIHLDEIRQFQEVQKKSYTFFEEGDVLFAKVTPCMENGKIAIAKDLKNKMGYGSSEFHVFRVREQLSNEYLFHFLVQEKFRADSQHAMTGAVGLKRVPKKFLEDYEIPLPSIKEQHQIVQEIESRLSVCDKVEESISKSLEKAKALRQSILKKAFEGTLLSEKEIAACKAAPDYEPASVLLERIKAEKKKK
jgi:type I restriction enzyme S subunit